MCFILWQHISLTFVPFWFRKMDHRYSEASQRIQPTNAMQSSHPEVTNSISTALPFITIRQSLLLWFALNLLQCSKAAFLDIKTSMNRTDFRKYQGCSNPSWKMLRLSCTYMHSMPPLIQSSPILSWNSIFISSFCVLIMEWFMSLPLSSLPKHFIHFLSVFLANVSPKPFKQACKQSWPHKIYPTKAVFIYSSLIPSLEAAVAKLSLFLAASLFETFETFSKGVKAEFKQPKIIKYTGGVTSASGDRGDFLFKRPNNVSKYQKLFQVSCLFHQACNF